MTVRLSRLRLLAATTACVLALTEAAAGAATVPAPAKAPAALLAITLLKAAKLPTVLPGITGRQDDGGYTATYPESSFVSEVETATATTDLKITLAAYASKAAAARGFTAQSRGFTKLPGVRDKAAISPDYQAVVLRGSQVVLVTVSATPAGNDLIASGDKSAEVLDQVLGAPLLAAATALAHHMNGKPAKKPYTHLPAGAYNPCAVSAAALKAKLKHPVVVTPSASEQPPSQQCNYTINGQPFLVETLTNAQAVTASPPTTLDAVFDADLAARNSRHNALTATIGRVKMFMIPDTDWQTEMVVESSPKGIPPITTSAVTDGGLGTHGVTLVRVLNGYTFPVGRDTCFDLMTQELQAELARDPNANRSRGDYERSRGSAEIAFWCGKLRSTGTNN